jgi:hypothetical protein
MKFKIVKHGFSYVICITKWAKKNGWKAGDYIDVRNVMKTK